MADLVIWPDELRAEQAGEAIELTVREVKMLLLLVEKRISPSRAMSSSIAAGGWNIFRIPGPSISMCTCCERK